MKISMKMMRKGLLTFTQLPFSEGFEWANMELPVSMFAAGNVPDGS